MSAWDEIASSYVESVTSAFPLHRLAVAVVAFVAGLAISHQTHLSIFETMGSMELFKLFDTKSTLLQKVTLLDVFVGVLAPGFAWALTRLVTRLIFLIVVRGAGLRERSSAAHKKYESLRSMELKQRREEIEVLNQGLVAVRMRLKWFNACGEILFGTAIIFLISSKWGNAVDVLVGGLSLGFATTSSAMALALFFREYYGVALFIALLQGKSPPTPPLT